MPRAVRDDARAFFDEASVCRGVGCRSDADADADARRRNASVPAPRSPARRERPLPPRGTVSCASLVVIHPCNQSRHGIIDSRESGRVAPNSPNHSPNQKGWLQFSTIGRTSGFSLAVFMDTGPRPWSPSSNARLRRTTSCRHNTESSDNGKLATLDHSGFLRCVGLPKP